MKVLLRIAIFSVMFSGIGSFANAEQSSIDIITDNVVKVCKKPDSAGSYWDIRVKGSGEAAIKLKLTKLGITGESAFSKGEWDGIKTTVEDAKDYRDCVKELVPVFLKKFVPLIPKKEVVKAKPRFLGGIKWQDFGAGVSMTLNSCYSQGSSVFCSFKVMASDSDVVFQVGPSSAIYDQKGRKYTSSYASIASFKGALKNNYLISELIRNVEVDFTIKFSDVSEKSKSISKVMIISNTRGKGGANNYKYIFRNVKIRIR